MSELQFKKLKQTSNLKSETGNIIKKFKLTLIITIIIILTVYTLIDIYVFHQGNLEETIFTLDFHEFWTYLITVLLFTILYVFSHLIVIKQKKADQKIIEAERNYSRLLEGASNLFSSITDGISIIDNDFNIVQINPTIKKWYSFKNQIIGEKCYEIYCNRNNPCKNCPNFGNLDKTKSASIIIPKLDKEGNQCGWLESSLYPLIEKISLEKVGAIYYIKDITNRKIIEEKLKESEEKFRNIAENSLIGIIILQDGLIKYANDAAAKLFEYPIEELFKWSKDDLDKNIHPDDLPILLKYANKKILKPLNKNSHISYRIKTRSKTLKWVEQYLSRIIFQGYDAALITLVDITRQKEAENLIIQENLKLIELSQLRKELITRVSHEFKTPLNLVYGASQILSKYKNEISSEGLKYIEIIEKGGERLNKLIEDLIDCSKIESQDLFIRRKTENLVEIVKERVEELIYFANQRGILLNIEIPKDLYLNIDKFRIEQVITNLLSNAIKNTPAKGIINIILHDSDNYVDLSIQDTGIGLTENEKQKLFKKFGKIERQGKSLGINTEGSGLGLYLSNEIIKLHGGQILVNSEGRNKGATFTIKLRKTHLN